MSALTPLLEPRGIVVLGASEREGKLGHAMMASLVTFPGVVAPVNPGSDSMYRSVAAAAEAHPDALDLALLCVPAPAVPRALRDAAAAGIRAAVVCAGGFGEVGEAGARVQAEVEAAVAETGIRLLGPNTSGFFRPGGKLFASFVPGVASLSDGSVGIVAASGGVNHALAFQLDRVGAGVSIGVGIGGGHDVGAAEVLDHLTDDPRTRSIALHLEAVPDGPRLLDAVRRATAVKPVAALVVGRNDDIAAFAQSHTGALATSWATTRALLRQAGAVVVDSEVELVNAASALTAPRAAPSPAPGVGLVTGQAGPGLIMADELGTRGLALPDLQAPTAQRLSSLLPPLTYLANPVDTGRPGPEYPAVLAAVAGDAGVDLLGVYGITEPVVTLPDAVQEAGVAVPTLVAVDGPADEIERVRSLAPADLPVLVGPTALVHGLAALAADARARAHRADGGAPPSSDPSAGEDPAGPGPWHEAAAKDLLDTVGLATPPRRVCRSLDEALRAQRELPGALAVKLLDAAVLHKSDVGGVHLGVTDEAGMRAAVAALDEIGAPGYLVESMAAPGRDLLLDVRTDPVFGLVAVLGLGGVEAEIWGDTAICALPAAPGDLAALPDQLVGRSLVDGYRGGPVLDRDELARLVTRLGALVAAAPYVTEIEINPLRLTPAGLVALDAVVIATEETP